jgi:1,4-dihydroxy-2-naphthoate octaprenyltransferase
MKVLYCVLLLVPFVIAGFLALFYPVAWLAMFGLLAALPACVIVLFSTTAKEQILALKLTGLVQLVFGVVLGLAFFYTPGIAA